MHQITLLSHWWVTSDGPHVGKWVVLGFILDFKICMQDFIKCLGTYIGRSKIPKKGCACSHQRLEHHLTSSTPDRIVVVRQRIVLDMCRAKVTNRFLTSFRWLSGMDGLFKMGVKVTKTKHKNKFMWSIKNQLTRSKCLPKLYSSAFHSHHYSPHCHSNDMLILLIY